MAATAGGDRHTLPPEAQCVGLQPPSGTSAPTTRRAAPKSLLCYSYHENQEVSVIN